MLIIIIIIVVLSLFALVSLGIIISKPQNPCYYCKKSSCEGCIYDIQEFPL